MSILHQIPNNQNSRKAHQGTRLKTRLRFLHNIAATANTPVDGYPVNVFVDGVVVLQNVFYKDYSDYIRLPAGKHMITVIPTRVLGVILELKVCLKKHSDYTIIAMGLLTDQTTFPLILKLYEDENQLDCCKSSLRFIQGAAGLPNLDLLLNRDILFPDVAYTEEGSTETGCSVSQALKCGKYEFQLKITGTETTIVGPLDLYLESNKIYTLVATGLIENSDFSTTLGVIPIENKAC